MELDPKVFEEAMTTLWSFPDRGKWATHDGTYRGNWSPYVPRNLILKYTHPGDRVLDCFAGGGTTAIEAKLLGRRCMGLDINETAIKEAENRVTFEMPAREQLIYEPVLQVGDARDLSVVPNDYVDLVCTHPPYANAVRYTDVDADLSHLEVKPF
ncbi:MAG TPA: DNA methyltransferase, partial [Anaerolineales bacterium]